MAVWGQGDPRWIVESRDDGKNVNNWHWSEVNKLEWTKQRLAELLPGLEAPQLELPATEGTTSWTARVVAVKSVTGEAMLTTRKGNKRFAYYDLKLTLGWEAAPRAPPPDADSADAAAAAGDADAGADVAAASDAATAEDEPLDAAAEGEAVATAEGEPAGAAAQQAAAERVSGEITVAEFGSGSDHDDIEVAVTVSGGGEAAAREPLRRHAQAALWPLVLQRLEQYVKELGEA